MSGSKSIHAPYALRYARLPCTPLHEHGTIGAAAPASNRPSHQAHRLARGQGSGASCAIQVRAVTGSTLRIKHRPTGGRAWKGVCCASRARNVMHTSASRGAMRVPHLWPHRCLCSCTRLQPTVNAGVEQCRSPTLPRGHTHAQATIH